MSCGGFPALVRSSGDEISVIDLQAHERATRTRCTKVLFDEDGHHECGGVVQEDGICVRCGSSYCGRPYTSGKEGDEIGG